MKTRCVRLLSPQFLSLVYVQLTIDEERARFASGISLKNGFRKAFWLGLLCWASNASFAEELDYWDEQGIARVSSEVIRGGDGGTEEGRERMEELFGEFIHEPSDSAELEGGIYRFILEKKYNAPIERLKVVEFSPTTKVLWFDWELRWWGSFNVVEISADGEPIYWYDILQPPTAQSIERVRVLHLNGRPWLEVIDRTHQGNGMLYLYEVKDGFVRKHLNTRVRTNLGGLRFSPSLARIEYRDVTGNGYVDVVVSAEWIDERGDGGTRTGDYYREFHYRHGTFSEDRAKRKDYPEFPSSTGQQ